ncbi:MAG TPA: hypothetical protein VIC85_13380 [Ktedonobacterales bacterium]|jgi:hypothetical protein
MGQATALFHLMGALRRAAGRVFLAFVLTLIIVGGGTIVAYVVLRGGSFTNTFVDIAAAFIGVGWAIAVSLLVLVFEVIRGLVAGVRDAAKDAQSEIHDAGKLVEGVAHSIEHGRK